MLALLRACTSESTDPRPCFQALQYRLCSLLSFAALLFFIVPITKINIHYPYYTCITISSPTSAPIQITIVFGVLGTQETFYYLVAELFERDHLHPTPSMD